jgi:hypothetical protein
VSWSSQWCYMPCPSHPPWHHHSNYTWRQVQVTKLLIMQFTNINYRKLILVSTNWKLFFTLLSYSCQWLIYFIAGETRQMGAKFYSMLEFVQ